VLLKEMQSLGLDVKVEGEVGPELLGHEEDDDLLRAAEELGIDLSGGGLVAPDGEGGEQEAGGDGAAGAEALEKGAGA
jgi:DNA-directed RNA polymerase subunit beta